LVEAVAAAAAKHGAVFSVDTRIVSIDEGPGGRVAVETEHGVSFADTVILAAGSWTDQVPLVATSPTAVTPIRGQLLHLKWPASQMLGHVLWAPDCYLVPWPDGRVLVGATVEDVGFDERTTAAGVRQLVDAACALVPELCQASFAEARVGLRPASGDALPIVGRSVSIPNVIYATGHFRNGVLLAPLTAALVADVVFDRPRDRALDLLAPSRFGGL
jgi:glycine oxidase